MDEEEEKAKKIVVDKIKYLYPNAEIKEENKKIIFDIKDDEINEFYKIKTEDMYSLTKNMVEFLKENKNK